MEEIVKDVLLESRLSQESTGEQFAVRQIWVASTTKGTNRGRVLTEREGRDHC
jgi:hypothetical protein